ncbi:hypothetical protein ACFCYB_40345 [Streptomyces sp. NPDC056309]|uniref:hypothetical protein n=1 Tax=unclassified Streptomyces TaxID=2593676 RepID=UPI0035DA11DB
MSRIRARDPSVASSLARPVVPVPPAPRPVPAPAPIDDDQEQELDLEDLTREQVLDRRVPAMKDLWRVFGHDDRYGESSARRLFTRRLVNQVQRLAGLVRLNLGYIPRVQA